MLYFEYCYENACIQGVWIDCVCFRSYLPIGIEGTAPIGDQYHALSVSVSLPVDESIGSSSASWKKLQPVINSLILQYESRIDK